MKARPLRRDFNNNKVQSVGLECSEKQKQKKKKKGKRKSTQASSKKGKGRLAGKQDDIRVATMN